MVKKIKGYKMCIKISNIWYLIFMTEEIYINECDLYISQTLFYDDFIELPSEISNLFELYLIVCPLKIHLSTGQ